MPAIPSRDRAVVIAEQDRAAGGDRVGADVHARGCDQVGAEAEPPRRVMVARDADNRRAGVDEPA